ncbi:MAG: copper-binding protein [Actinobacteria bacterium]|nr:copper-binding protein [Actinomycetota bacterium]
MFLVMVNIDLKISGMTCQNCVRHVKEAISLVSGVKSVDVSLENASAKISCDFDLDRGALKGAVHEAGYAIVE